MCICTLEELERGRYWVVALQPHLFSLSCLFSYSIELVSVLGLQFAEGWGALGLEAFGASLVFQLVTYSLVFIDSSCWLVFFMSAC